MSLIIDLKVIPGAKHVKVIIDKSERIVFYLKSVAQENKANEELIKTLAAKLAIPKSCISIMSGHKIRYKRVLIDCDIALDVVLNKLGLIKSQNMTIW